MVDFRRGITALAILALFAGLAAAQVGPSQQLTCNTNVTVTPSLRGEGYTEQTGDITLSCTGGTQPTAVGQVLPQVNFSIFYNTAVTSRLFSTGPNISEALLLIDEPGSGLPPIVPGFGPAAPQNVCPTPLTGCSEVSNQVTGGGIWVATNAVSPVTPGYNVFQGVVSGNSVTFFGIPVLAPGTTSSRVFRITNVRVNANPLAGGSASGASPVQASISISGATSLLISNATPYVGFVQNGLTATVSGSTSLNQCATQTKQSVTTLRFDENFGTAFKTRVAAQNNTQYAGQATPGSSGFPAQNTPGAIYNSESNLVVPVNSSGSQVAGLADYGTRLKATFNNVPAGVNIWVSTVNVFNNAVAVAPTPGPAGGNLSNSGTTGFAQLVTGETTTYATANGFTGALVTATDNATGPVPIAQIPITNGSGQAVWEVVNTNPNTNERFAFAVYVSYTANVAQNSPPAGTATVNLSYAPTPPVFTAAAGATASSTLTIPRFTPDTSAARNFLVITICRTILLYPYITNQAGFDTGISIANTSVDPFGTASQTGGCTLNWYGGTTAAPTTPPGPTTVAPFAGGSIYVNTAQALVPNFQGYMIAVCNFQYAHGFAFISDVGARNLAMGYLAVVIADPGTGSRVANPIGGSLTSSGEQGAH